MNKTESRVWQAKWITSPEGEIKPEKAFSLKEMFEGAGQMETEPVEERLRPPAYFIKRFSLPEKEVVAAFLHITARGIYEAKLNGRAVTDACFAPDYTSYQHYLQYQTYEITDLLAEENSWSVVLADGWYGGRISVQGGSAQFGDRLSFLGEIELRLADGEVRLIGTDDEFGYTTGKYCYSDICIGEKQDLRLDVEGQLDSVALRPVQVVSEDYGALVPQFGPQVKVMEELPARKIWREGDAVIVDFGQVIAGRVALSLDLAEGQRVEIEHAEVLDEQGQFFNNIVGRNKDQRDVYIGRGERAELVPAFTFHGFRFIRITGYEKPLACCDLKAQVLYSAMRKAGHMKTSNLKINQLLANIEWSQKGNMLSIPTDCPQRERVGWTGDIQVFSPTASFFMDVEDFLTRWLQNVTYEQLASGEVLDYSPAPKDFYQSVEFTGSLSSAGWGDAIILVPWVLYERYGNTNVLAACYEAMVKWHEFSKRSAAGDKEGDARYIWDTKFHYGDWMFPSYMIGPQAKGPMETAKVTKDLVATAFLAHSSEILGKIAARLGKKEDAAGFKGYSDEVRRAFEERFYQDGQLTADFQGCYTLAVAFDLLREEHKAAAVGRLVDLIEANQFKLDTGFLSVPYLLDVLADNGYAETARRVFLQEECPSWFYEINQGATTIWESWAGIDPDGGKVGRYSFNHYAFGCVGDWLVRKVGGLKVKKPGFEEFYVAPDFDFPIAFLALTYETKYGQIRIHWQKDEAGGMAVECEVPERTTGFLVLPDGAAAGLGSEYLTVRAEGRVVILLPAGKHRVKFQKDY
ncbi:alpha-L-rhamnosidase [Listeria costaricensis]|uniref:alpha-L-rhamnosidase n=1 Tax=Listeria costaricensis TaxID=2026604 RepID=UPI000C06B61F|nr:alpha-L-rhamnosidase [Listeria costaricensis]